MVLKVWLTEGQKILEPRAVILTMVVFPSGLQGCLAMSGDTFDCHHWGWHTTGI